MRKRVIILGGLGFIGKNLYNQLSRQNYDVSIVADRVGDEGDGFINDNVKKHIVKGSILDVEFLERNLRQTDVIFSLAGSSGASDSIKNPYKDLDTNLKGHLNILEVCRKHNPGALLVFPSSRLVYGKPMSNPVNENHPLQPESIYAIHKLTTEHYYLLYQRLYNLNCIILRISNPFGPYQRFGSNHYGILNWFIHKAIAREEIEIYGDGSQQRDFIHIDDLVNVLERSIESHKLYGRVFNVGFGQGISIKEAVDIIKKYKPETKVTFKPWPEIDKKIETGDYVSDISLLENEIGWKPKMNFEEGILNTIKFYESKSGG
jgi:UDP-glucose 4-epimerase